MKINISQSQLADLRLMLDAASKVVITAHKSADGDAIGSSLGLAELLRSLGKQVEVILPDRFTSYLAFLPGYDSVRIHDDHPEGCRNMMMAADLVFCLDFNVPHRVGNLMDALLASPAKKVLIDHHEDPSEFCDITLSYPKLSSTCELIYRLIVALGLEEKLTPLIATYLYTGLVTDTGNFAYRSADAETLETGAALVRLGADKLSVWENAVNATSLSALRLCSYAMSEKMLIFSEIGLAVMSLNIDELHRFDFQKGDTDGLVNRPLSVPNIRWSVLISQDIDNQARWKVSMRSKGTFDVNVICRDYFGGGGHVNAAGADFYGTEQEVVDRIIAIKDKMAREG